MEISKLTEKLDSTRIEVVSLREHSKASEKYADVIFHYPDGHRWEGTIPYYYRRSGLFIEDEASLVDYLNKIYPLFEKEKMDAWVEEHRALWASDHKGREVTKAFFDRLLNLKWNSVTQDLPRNPNWARRTQDIKEMGYTLATHTKMKIAGGVGNDTHLLLVPLPLGKTSGYEGISKKLRNRIVTLLGNINVYELSSANKHGLLPDHKFPEIRWDSETKQENPDSMVDEEIIKKFQLLDNQRNQQKREVCRGCFQSNKRGTIFGINFFYEGSDTWPPDIPKIGKAAEKGCVGCPWYDLVEWRRKLNEKLSSG